MARSLDTPNGWHPDARRAGTPNFTHGRSGQKVLASTQHVTAGPKGNEFSSCVSWFGNPAARASAHFLIGKDGAIVQFVSVHDTAWANGLRWDTGFWYNARNKQVAPTWALLRAPTDPNLTTVSIEHAGQSNERWTDAMFNATVVVLRWLGQTFGMTWVPRRTLIGHFEIDTVDKRNCPGPYVDWERLATAASQGAPLPTPLTRYEVLGLPIYQKPEGTGPLAGYLRPGELVVIDKTYPDKGTGHLVDGRGFVDMDGLKTA